MIYCYLEDWSYDDEYEIIGFMDSENHNYDDTVFHIYYHNSFKHIMKRILDVWKPNNIEMSILNQGNNNWSFAIKKRDINDVKKVNYNT